MLNKNHIFEKDNKRKNINIPITDSKVKIKDPSQIFLFFITIPQIIPTIPIIIKDIPIENTPVERYSIANIDNDIINITGIV